MSVMKIVLWSNQRGTSGSSTLSAALATMIAVRGNHKTFLSHPMMKDQSLESYLLSEKERTRYSDISETGADGLFRLLQNGRLESEVIKDYSYSLLSRSNLDFLCSKKVYCDEVEHHNNYLYLLHKASEFYDVLVTDLNVPARHPMFYPSLKGADVLLIVAPPSQYALGELMAILSKEKDKLRQMNLHIQLVMHPVDARCSVAVKQIIKPHRIKLPMTISYDSGIKDACNRSNLLDYCLKESTYDGHRKKVYFKDLEKLAEKVMQWSKEVAYV